MKKNGKLILTLKYGIAIIPIIWIALSLRPEQFLEVLRNTSPWTTPVFAVGILLTYTIHGIRWWMTIKAFTPTVPFLHAMRIHFISIFYSIALPSSAATDIVRTVMLSKDNDTHAIWAATWVARVLSLVSICIVAAFGYFNIDEVRTIENVGWYATGAVIVAFLIVAASFSSRVARTGGIILRRIIPQKVFSVIAQIQKNVIVYRNKKRVLVEVFAMTILFYLIYFLTLAAGIAGITGHFNFWDVCGYGAVIEFICSAFPFTPSGMGIRELLSSQMFNYLGFSSEQLGVYVLLLLFAMALKLVCGIPLLFTNKIAVYSDDNAEQMKSKDNL